MSEPDENSVSRELPLAGVIPTVPTNWDDATGELDPAGLRQGRWLFEDSDGASATLHYVDGFADGPTVRRYPSGRRRLSGYFEGDMAHGTFVFWDQGGAKTREIPVVRGLPHGMVRFFYSDGLLRCLQEYVQGVPGGYVGYWDERGVLEFEGLFEPNAKAGETVLYAEEVVVERGCVVGHERVGAWSRWVDGARVDTEYPSRQDGAI